MVKLTPLFSTGNNHDASASLSVVIAYDKISACRRAMSMLIRLLEQDTELVNASPVLLPLARLQAPDVRDQVASGAISADLLILSLSNAGMIPPAIESLVWALLCLRPNTTVLALLGNRADWHIFIQEIVGDPKEWPSAVELAPSAALRQLRFRAPITP